MQITHKQQIYNKVYSSLVDKIGKENAKNWADSTVRTFTEGVYDDLDLLIEGNIKYALEGDSDE